MIKQAKSSVCLVEKAKGSCLDVVHTHPDGMLSDKRSTEPSASGCFTLEAEKQRKICRKKIISLTLASEHACINN